MDIAFHPSAEAAFNEKAAGIVRLVAELPPEPSRSRAFQTQRHIAAHITDKEMLGEPRISWVNYQGGKVGSMFLRNGKQHGLRDETYKPLSDLAQSIRKVPWAASCLSQAFVEETLFDWVRGRFIGGEVPDLFCSHLFERSRAVIVTELNWIPIANLEVEAPFPVGAAEVRPLDKATVAAWVASINGPPDQVEQIRRKVGERLLKFQGFACVVMEVTAEPRHALALAFEEANRVAALLAVFSPGILIPDVKCLSKPKGSETLTQVTRVRVTQDGRALMEEAILDRASAQCWTLDSGEIHMIRKAGLDAASELYRLAEPNEFQRTVANALSIYARAAFTADPVEKIVFVLSSLESLLLKNETEGIQQNLSERLALLSAKELDKRKKIIASVKEIYGIRSRYLHHGRPSSELEAIGEFLVFTWHFYTRLLVNTNQFASRADFISFIDDVKLSGPA